MLVLALFLILSSVAIYSSSEMYQQVLANACIEKLKNMIVFGEFLSFETQDTVTICPLDKKNHCVDDWSKTIFLFLDPTAKHQLSQETTVLRTMQCKVSTKNAHICFHGFISSAYLMLSAFNFDGTQNGSFSYIYWPSETPIGAGLSISRVGHLRYLSAMEVSSCKV